MASKFEYVDLMSMAERNARKGQKKAEQTLYPTLSKPRKADPKQEKLSQGIQKFLAQKKEEEKKKQDLARQKREQLIELRNQDRKAKKRVGQMLRMTKSANKACIGDAMDCLNDSLAAQGDTHQPDEDDYGYVSQSADQWHQKLIENYKNIPVSKPVIKKPALEVPVVKALSSPSTEEQRVTPAKRHENGSQTVSVIVSEEKPKKSGKRTPAPPPSYVEVLKLAEQKSQLPVITKKPKVDVQQGPEFEFGRPMTAKEKAAYLQEKAYKERVNKGTVVASSDRNNNAVSTPIKLAAKSDFKIPYKKTSEIVDPSTSFKVSNVVSNPAKLEHKAPAKFKSKTPTEADISKTHLKPALSTVSPRVNAPKPQPKVNENNITDVKVKSELGVRKLSTISSRELSKKPVPTQRSEHPVQERRISTPNHAPQILTKPKLPVVELKARQRPPPSKQRESGAATRLDEAPAVGRKIPPKPSKGRAVIDSDEEYDSEMDDFIDDSEVDPGNISEVIGQIFGYRRERYVNEESDDECMESSVAQQMKEEQRSLQLGIKEDLEDMKREEEEEKRKKILMKKKKTGVGKR